MRDRLKFNFWVIMVALQVWLIQTTACTCWIHNTSVILSILIMGIIMFGMYQIAFKK